MSNETNVDATPETTAATTQQETADKPKTSRVLPFELASGVKCFTQYPFLAAEVEGGDPTYIKKHRKLNRSLFANDEVFISWRQAYCNLQIEDATDDFNELIEKFKAQRDEEVNELTMMADIGIDDPDGKKGKLANAVLGKFTSDEEKRAFARMLLGELDG